MFRHSEQNTQTSFLPTRRNHGSKAYGMRVSAFLQCYKSYTDIIYNLAPYVIFYGWKSEGKCHWNSRISLRPYHPERHSISSEIMHLSVSTNLYVHITHWFGHAMFKVLISWANKVVSLCGAHRTSQKLKSGNQKYTGGQVQGLSKTGQECKSRGKEKWRRGLRDAASDIRREPRELKATSAQVVQGQGGQSTAPNAAMNPEAASTLSAFSGMLFLWLSSTRGKHSISSSSSEFSIKIFRKSHFNFQRCSLFSK